MLSDLANSSASANLHFERSKNAEGGRQSLSMMINIITETEINAMVKMSSLFFHRTFRLLHIVLANDDGDDDSSIFSSHAGSEPTLGCPENRSAYLFSYKIRLQGKSDYVTTTGQGPNRNKIQ